MEFMQKLELDPQKSKLLYEEHPANYRMRECYANVYRAVTDYMDRFRSGEWKVVYGYYTISEMPELMPRHCFILDEAGRVIDPTIFSHKKVNVEHDYYAMYVFSDPKEYMTAVANEGFYPSLERFMQPYIRQAYEWAKAHNLHVCG